MKIKADREVCVGAGMCVLTAGTVFDQDDDDGRVVLISAEPSADQHDVVRDAVDLCPSGALSIEE